MFGARILVLVPHPDDEVVGCCTAIVRARRRGARIFALYLSNGVPARAQSWPWERGRHAAHIEERWREATRARALLGIEEAGREDCPTRTLRDRLAETEARLARAIAATDADVMWCPAFEGGHQDHDAANALASRFAGRLTVLEFAEYNNAGGRTRSQDFPAPSGAEIVLDLDPDEVALKRRALAVYVSERSNLRHIGTAREAFRPLPRHDYARPPHDGTLFYARYRWVPLHPRVDRTNPAEVYRALSSFVASPVRR